MGIDGGLMFAFLAMIFWGFGDFFIQKTVRKIGSFEALAFIGLIGSLGMLPFIWNDFGILFSGAYFLILLFLGILVFVFTVSNFEALKEGKLSVIDVILELELPITIVLGFIFFKESLSFLQFLIIFFIFFSILMMAVKSKEHLRIKLEKGVILALITAAGFGIINFLTAYSSRTVSPLMAIWIPWVMLFVFSCFFIVKKGGFRKFLVGSSRNKKIIFFMAVFDTLAWIFYSLAVSKNEVSIITAVTESYPAIALILAVTFNKEKIKWYQYLGVFTALGLS